MKIVNRVDFLSLPANTLFSKFSRGSFEELCIKGDTLPSNDFQYQDIVDAIECTSSKDYDEVLSEAVLTGASMPMDFENLARDGCFDENQMFAVWEASDIRGLMVRLQQSISS